MNATTSFFEATAMPDREWWHALWPDPERVLRTLGVAAGMTVVDLCCGDGYFTAPLSRMVDGRVHGIDIDPAMLARTRAELQRCGASVLGLIEAEAHDIAVVLPGRVDFVLLANTFHGVPDKTALARRVADALEAGGRFAIVNWHAAPRETTVVLGMPRGPRTELRLSPEETRRAVEPAGFGLDRVIELPPYHYAAIFVRASAG